MRSLASAVSALAERHRVPGAQLAIRRGSETTTIEIGELEHRSRRQVIRNAAFPIGSISKTFTATLAMVLVADGDLDLDEPIAAHLPALGELGRDITLRQLLSHTAGLVSGPSSEEVSSASLARYVLDHCQPHSVLLPPGAAFSYSNIGYVLVGHLIETVTRMTWWEAMESILLAPLGITPAFVAAPHRRPSARPVATGHSVHVGLGKTRPVRQSLSPAEAPAGGLAVSAEDLALLGSIQLGAGEPGILPAATAEEMRRAVPEAQPFGLADGWGLGLALFRAGDRAWLGHDGNADGTSCYLRVDPQEGWVVAFTSNSTTGIGLWQELAPALAEAGIPVPSAEKRPPGAAVPPPAGCAGTYANGDTEYVVAPDPEGKLALSVDGDPCGQLTLYGDLTFTLHDPASGQHELGGRFMQDSTDGIIGSLQFGGRLARRRDDRSSRQSCRPSARMSA